MKIIDAPISTKGTARRRAPLMVAMALAALAPNVRPARAGEAAAAEAPGAETVGVGYKIGNGLGFMGGDIIIHPAKHLAFDLQLNYANPSVDTTGRRATGFGVSPTVRYELFPHGSTPYLGIGFVYARLSSEQITAAATGAVANIGWHWKWRSGLALILGGGIVHLSRIEATDGVSSISQPGGTHLNIEAGLRYMFL
jgi:hypothetical protein